MTELPQTFSCFACGSEHPFGLNLAMSTDGDRVRCLWTPRQHHAGFQHAVHGGLIATALDEIMAWACGILAGRFAYSVEITVRYHKVLMPGTEVECVGGLTTTATNARVLQTKGEILAGGERIASATGKYLPIKEFSGDHLRAEFGEEGAEQIRGYMVWEK